MPWENEILKLWENPSFGSSTQWIIVEDRDNKVFLVRELKLSQPYHEVIKKEWFEEAKHLIYREAILDEATIDKWLDKGAKIPVSLFYIQAITGYDGTYYGFKYWKYDAYSELRWWSDGPKEWHPIIAWYHDCVAWLKSELDKQSPDSS